jgi:hypothetical protein
VLGIHLRPRQEVRILRSALRDAAAAGASARGPLRRSRASTGGPRVA